MFIKEKLLSTLFIDIRGEVLRAVQGRWMDSRLNLVVDKFGEIVLPEKLNSANSLHLSSGAQKLKDFLQKRAMKATRVVAGLGHNGIITRNVRVPLIPLKDLDGMMRLNINDYLPVSPEEYSFDYKLLKEVEEDGQQYLELMVAAVSHSQVEQCALLLERAGLKPLAIDILPNMLYRLFEHWSFQNNLVVDGGLDGTHLAIFKGKELFMYTDIPFVYASTGEQDFSVLVQEMSGYLDYFSSRNYGKSIDGITIVGELSECQGLEGILGQYFAFPVNIGLSRDGGINFKGKADKFSAQAAKYVGNLGLMMREKCPS